MSRPATLLLLLACILLVACSRPASRPVFRDASTPEPPPACSVASAAPPASSAAPARPAPAAVPGLSALDPIVRAALDKHEIPGAVVLIVHRDQIVFRKAWGVRSLTPVAERMTPDTIFDLASLTKPIATATCIHLLAQQRRLQLTDPVARYWPAFAAHGKQNITIEHLLLHTSGLPASTPLGPQSNPEQRLSPLADLRPSDPPGKVFRYSDAGYVVLGELVRRISGEPLDRFFASHIAGPLGLTDTSFNPEASLFPRIAPTEKRDHHMLRGTVHDWTASQLGGVAGHAGLFSSADDLAVFSRMLLSGGIHDGHRLLQESTIRQMTRPRATPAGLRSAGWDVATGYSTNRGSAFSLGGYGHTGFTGTSLWIDPATRTAVIVLTSRLYPDGKGDPRRLRAEIATLVARQVQAPPEGARTLVGLDVLARDGSEWLKGRNVALVTNATGVNREGKSALSVLRSLPGVRVVALFAPEHGLGGAADARIGDGHEPHTGLPVYSLYGPRNKPSAEQLQGVDAIVYDLQDAGVRFFTFATTLGYLLETAAAHHLRIVVLDRPEPSGGLQLEGPVSDQGAESFTCYHAMPIRYGMTPGELAGFLNADRNIGADLHVIRMEGWTRGEPIERTGVPWVRPSPNLPTPAALRLYPGVALLEASNVSVGSGTDHPIELVGAPWLEPTRLVDSLEQAGLPGVHFVPTRFVPVSHLYAKQPCSGVRILVTDPSKLQPVRVGVELARTLIRLYPSDWNRDQLNFLLASTPTLQALERGDSGEAIAQSWAAGLEAFQRARAPFLLYADPRNSN